MRICVFYLTLNCEYYQLSMILPIVSFDDVSAEEDRPEVFLSALPSIAIGIWLELVLQDVVMVNYFIKCGSFHVITTILVIGFLFHMLDVKQ